MISKPVPANSFYHTCRYISNKPGAELLIAEGVRGHDYKLMAADFETQQQLRPDKTRACFHSILSFYPGEKPTDELLKEIALKYLTELGVVNTQVAISKHTDKAHLHLHIVANMVNNAGKTISDSWIGLRGKKIAQQLTQDYKLIPALEKNLKLTNLESLSSSEANRYKIYVAITKNLPYCRTMEDLEKRLLKLGIETKYKYKGQTDERQGISFKMGDISFKGSQVDRKFSLSGLEKAIMLQQKQVQVPRQLPGNKEILKEMVPARTRPIPRVESDNNSPEPGNEYSHHIAKGLEKAVDMLLRSEETPGQLPYELTQKALKQKRKRKSQQNSR
ncbi:relaxase/mobilization nuclease domain protein [Ostertagia ostertagi]